jgi:hypothetical protein
MDRSDVQQVAEGVFRVGGRMVNWYLLRDGRDLTLVDAGYPAHAGDVESSIRLLGHEPSDVRALLITHAHVDHIGAAGPLHTQFGTPAYCSAAEVPHAHREFLEQVTPLRVLANAWRPGVLPWAVRAIRLGGTVSTAVPHAQPFPGVGPLDLPGRPVPVPTPGHTGGAHRLLPARSWGGAHRRRARHRAPHLAAGGSAAAAPVLRPRPGGDGSCARPARRVGRRAGAARSRRALAGARR